MDTLIPADLPNDQRIDEIKSTIVDVPTVRKHKLSSLSVTAQSYVTVELRLADQLALDSISGWDSTRGAGLVSPIGRFRTFAKARMAPTSFGCCER
jgi:hypothetical protein